MNQNPTRYRGPGRPWQLLFLFAFLAISFAAQTELPFGDGFEPAPPVATRIEVDPQALLLLEIGETKDLAAAIFDLDDQPISAPLSFASTDPDVVTVSATGQVEAVAPVGSAQVVVSTAGALNVAVLVIVAQAVEGALLISDDQVQAGPTAVAPDAPILPGAQVQLTVSGIAPPAPGTKVIGTGELPVGGQVVSAVTAGANVDLVLEIVPLAELFDAYAIDETIDLSTAPIGLDPEVSELYDMTRRMDGSFELAIKPGVKTVQGTAALLSVEENCSTSPSGLSSVLMATLGPSISFDPQFELDYVDGFNGVERLVLEGSATAFAEISPRVQAGLAGKYTCKYQLGVINVPAAGPLGALIAFQIDLGFGFEIGGSVSLTEAIGYDLTVTGQASFMAGIDCSSGTCDSVGEADASADGAFRLVYPPSLDSLFGPTKLQADAAGFLYVDLGVGNPIFTALSFQPIGINAGLRQRLDLESTLAQAANPGYASDFKLELYISAGATSEFMSLLELLGVMLPPLTIELTNPLAESPKGTLVIRDPNGGTSASPTNPPSVVVGTDMEPGELASFEVNLNPSTYLGIYNVEEVQILELTDDGMGGQMLDFARPLCSLFDPTPDQTQFMCQTDFLQTGTRTFYLFVKASLFGLELPFLLEAANNSSTVLEVTEEPPPTDGLVRGYVATADVDMDADSLDSDFDESPAGATASAMGSRSGASGNASGSASGLTAQVSASGTATEGNNPYTSARAVIQGRLPVRAKGSGEVEVRATINVSASASAAVNNAAAGGVCVTIEGPPACDTEGACEGCYNVCMPESACSSTGLFADYTGGPMTISLGSAPADQLDQFLGAAQLSAGTQESASASGTLTLTIVP